MVSSLPCTLILLLGLSGNAAAQGLQLLEIYPTQHQSHVLPDAEITLLFDQALDGASLEAAAIRVNSDQRGPVEGVWSGGGSENAHFLAAQPFHSGEQITFTVTSALLALSGDTPARGSSYGFTVRSAAASSVPVRFAQRPISGSGSTARDLKALDFDHDGDLDLLAAYEGTPEHLYLMENDEGTFCSTQLGANFRLTEVYDIDGDGDYDSFGATGAFDTELNWFENDGQPPFVEHVISSEDPWTLAGGDLDSDGDVDVLAAVILPNRLLWFANDGAGNFGPAMQIASSFTGGSDSWFRICNMDQDGDMDILAFHFNDFELVWYENTGSQDFVEHLIEQSTDRGRLSHGDLDGDGDIDLVLASVENSPQQHLAWYENDGAMNFTQHPIPTTSEGRIYCADMVDLDGDLDMDIFAGGYLFVNDGSQSFSESSLGGLGFSGQCYANGLDHADMDGDGDQDLLAIGHSTMAWYENASFLELNASEPAAGASSVDPEQVLHLHFSHDMDAATVNETSIHVVSAYHGRLDGSFSQNIASSVNYQPSQPFHSGDRIEVSLSSLLRAQDGSCLEKGHGFVFHIAAGEAQSPGFDEHPLMTHANIGMALDIADLDGDGDLDVASCSYEDLYWHENLGTGDFVSHEIPMSLSPVGLQLFDGNSDGWIDIWVDDEGWNSSVLFLNDGAQNFTMVDGSGYMNVEQVLDVNHDGDLDLVYLNRGNSVIHWLERNCGAYRGYGSVPANASQGVAAADLDQDGDTDFLAVSMAGALAYENDDFAMYTTRSIDPTACKALALVDFNADGKLDVATAENAGGLAWYSNQATEDSIQFGARQVIDILNHAAEDIVAVDLDGDGDMDLAVVSSNGGLMTWYLNRLNEAGADFALAGSAICPGMPRRIIAGDLDGDLDQDLVTLSMNDADLVWWENTGLNTRIGDVEPVPKALLLDPASPNPFNATTRITFHLPATSLVHLEVYNLRGSLVRSLQGGLLPAGEHRLQWDGRNELGLTSASAVYILRLETEQGARTRKLLLLK